MRYIKFAIKGLLVFIIMIMCMSITNAKDTLCYENSYGFLIDMFDDDGYFYEAEILVNGDSKDTINGNLIMDLMRIWEMEGSAIEYNYGDGVEFVCDDNVNSCWFYSNIPSVNLLLYTPVLQLTEGDNLMYSRLYVMKNEDDYCFWRLDELGDNKSLIMSPYCNKDYYTILSDINKIKFAFVQNSPEIESLHHLHSFNLLSIDTGFILKSLNINDNVVINVDGEERLNMDIVQCNTTIDKDGNMSFEVIENNNNDNGNMKAEEASVKVLMYTLGIFVIIIILVLWILFKKGKNE